MTALPTPGHLPLRPPYDALVLAGGSARRLGGADKASICVGGRPLLDRVLGSVLDAGRVVVVGPERSTGHRVSWCLEDPPGGGPVAGLAAGLSHVRADLVAVLAVDLPFAAPALDRLLLAAGNPDLDGVLLVDATGRDQPLLGVYRRARLLERLAALDTVEGAPLRAVLDGLTLHRIQDAEGAATDCDTWEDIALAQQRADGGQQQRTAGPGETDIRETEHVRAGA